MNFKTNADLKKKCKQQLETHVWSDVLRALQFFRSSLEHAKVPSTY